MAQQTIGIGAAPNDGTGDPIRTAFDKCNDNFTELYAGLTGLLDFKGSTDCSTNPNYPAASKGDFYVVSVAGKIGGASGTDVEVGDAYFAEADNAGGTQAAVGADWSILQGNTTGAGAGVDVQDETTPVLTASTLNFTGAGVVATDAGGGVATITIAGGGGGVDVEEEGGAVATATVLNFVGSAVTATDAGGGQVDVTIAGGSAALSALYEDQKAANTSGGSSTSGSWQTRTLNTEVYDDIGLTLASNQLSLAAGTYEVEATSAFFRSDACRIRLRDVTNSVTLALSVNDYATNTNGGGQVAVCSGRFTLAGTATVELQYRVNTSFATNGLGVLSNWGEVEVYSRLKLTKLS